MSDGRLQWHPAFSAACRIELAEDEQMLIFEDEHPLSKKPMLIDILIIKKQKGARLHKNIGHIFKGHNILEYKAPTDYLSANDFYKVYGYACFYLSDTKKVLDIHPGDITITFACYHYPRRMLKLVCRRRGLTIEKWLQSLRGDLKAGGEIR